MSYSASSSRYDHMVYRRCGRSGLKLPVLSLGLWHNFGGVDSEENGKQILFKAFDAGITHFDGKAWTNYTIAEGLGRRQTTPPLLPA